MPAFVKTKKDEKYWQEAKDAAEESYGKGKHKDDGKFWGAVTKIWKNKKRKHDKSYRKKRSNFDTNIFWSKFAIK